ncbi:hypothetical protein RV18_GL002511 [Enterococcus termitis]|nr:hypothetical protein RV18_GL002511 [Enterococcus termitis]
MIDRRKSMIIERKQKQKGSGSLSFFFSLNKKRKMFPDQKSNNPPYRF